MTQPDPATKLTKKQRKGLAFRQKLSAKRKPNSKREPEDVPEAEVPNDEEVEEDTLRIKEIKETPRKESSNSSNRRADRRVLAQELAQQREGDVNPIDAHADTQSPSKKRKRPLQSEPDTNPPSRPKKGKRNTPEQDENVDKDDKDAKSETHKSRFILFVGNLKYTTSKEAIQAHFSHCDPPPTVRLLTPKPKSSSSSTNKSKGCAFLEFSHRNALQQGLKVHHSTLDGRQINVELTAGGGGKSTTRLEKVKTRNRNLEMQRKKRVQKDSVTAPDYTQATAPTPITAQRLSSTSGASETPSKRRTWSIQDTGDEGPHRGGKKRGTKKRKARELGTGVNDYRSKSSLNVHACLSSTREGRMHCRTNSPTRKAMKSTNNIYYVVKEGMKTGRYKNSKMDTEKAASMIPE